MTEPKWLRDLHAQGVDGVAISDVDCTPRPRYRESQEAFERRMGTYARAHAQEARAIQRDNRAAALREVEVAGMVKYFTQCACGFCGLRVEDPEVARREYDAHACAISGNAHVDRAIATIDNNGPLIKRQHGDMQAVPSLAKDIIEHAPASQAKRIVEDDTEARMRMLELK